jgi:hypothetical protein
VDSELFGNVNFADTSLWLSCGFFFANHLCPHITYRYEEHKGAGYVDEQFFTPYRRIIPMHLTIIFGSIVILALMVAGICSTIPVLGLVLILITYSDISARRIKHLNDEYPDAPVQYLR